MNKALAQLTDLFRSMTPGARITAGLLLTVVVVSLAYLFNSGFSGPDTYLLGGKSFTDTEMAHIQVAFGQALNPVIERIAARIALLREVLLPLALEPAVAEHYARLRLALQRAGTPIGPNDLWLAAHALERDLTLVTNNEREFSRVPGLRVENWLR